MTTMNHMDGLPERVKTKADMEAFYRALLRAGINFHPDEDFHGYVSKDGPCFTDALADRLNDLMDDVFVVDLPAGEDPYSVALDVLHEHDPSTRPESEGAR